MKHIFCGVELEHIYMVDVEPETYDYIGQCPDENGELWDIIKNINTGVMYYTIV